MKCSWRPIFPQNRRNSYVSLALMAMVFAAPQRRRLASSTENAASGVQSPLRGSTNSIAAHSQECASLLLGYSRRLPPGAICRGSSAAPTGLFEFNSGAFPGVRFASPGLFSAAPSGSGMPGSSARFSSPSVAEGPSPVTIGFPPDHDLSCPFKTGS